MLGHDPKQAFDVNELTPGPVYGRHPQNCRGVTAPLCTLIVVIVRRAMDALAFRRFVRPLHAKPKCLASIDRVIRGRQAKLLEQPHDQIAGPPAVDAMDRWVRAFLHRAGNVCWSVCRARIDTMYWSDPWFALVEPDYPVPQYLTLQTADHRRLVPRNAIEDCPNRTQSRACPVTAYPMANDNPCAPIEGFFTGDLGLPSESDLLRIG